jgi:2-keto-4-pentenoate hydratase
MVSVTPTATGLATRLLPYADALRAAEESRTPIAPLTETDPALTVADAYAIQQHNLGLRLASGVALLGRKVGLTSKAMQAQLGVDVPDFGGLLADMGVEEGDDIPVSQLIQPRIEGEIAFVLGRDLTGPAASAVEALTAIEGALPALEIIDSRVADWKIKLVDTIADNASSARYVLGARLTPVKDLDLRLLGAVVSTRPETFDLIHGTTVHTPNP